MPILHRRLRECLTSDANDYTKPDANNYKAGPLGQQVIGTAQTRERTASEQNIKTVIMVIVSLNDESSTQVRPRGLVLFSIWINIMKSVSSDGDQITSSV